jgi:hypothetical protein
MGEIQFEYWAVRDKLSVVCKVTKNAEGDPLSVYCNFLPFLHPQDTSSITAVLS